MKQHPKYTIQRVASFLDKQLTEEQIDTIVEYTQFKNMKVNPMVNKSDRPFLDMSKVQFFRKGEVGDWLNYFSDEQSNDIDIECEKALAGTGLDFKYSI